MKKYLLVIAVGVAFLMTGCLDDDGYSLDKMWVGFGIFQETDSTSNSYQIAMDDSTVLIPMAIDFNIHYYVDNGDRVLVNFTILDDDSQNNEPATKYYVKINSVTKVLMKGILDITEEIEDSIGSNPINVQDVWLTDSLLNFKLKYWGLNKIHYINLVKQPGELNESSEQPIALELRHNSNGDDESLPYTAFVSFKLSALKITGLDSVKFVVTGTDYNGDEFDYDGVYHYSENNE